MNLLQLILKQMRQRALSTWLTVLSVSLGVGLAVAVLIFQREGDKLFGQSDFGYDVVIGAKGSRLNLVLNTAYHMGDASATGTLPYSVYASLPHTYRGAVRWALPYALGDNYQGHRIVATTPRLVGADDEGRPVAADAWAFEYRKGRRLELAAGRAFHSRKFEAVVGAEVAARTGLTVGSTFRSEHGVEQSKGQADAHEEQWTVVGVLKPTGTANDRVIFIPLISFYAIPEHEKGLRQMSELSPAPKPAHDDHDHKPAAATAPASAAHDDHDHHDHAYHMNADGTIHLHLPPQQWKLSAILVRSRGSAPALRMTWAINNLPEAMAVNPAMEMRQFFSSVLKSSAQVLLVISACVSMVAAVSILVSIYNSVAARRREIAILRALGATRRRILLLVCLEAALVALVGAVLGLVLGHLLAGAGSSIFRARVGEALQWTGVSGTELLYVAAVVVLAAIAGLVPAVKAYSTPVATNLAAE
jgi:putative ABC transport system permease protein